MSQILLKLSRRSLCHASYSDQTGKGEAFGLVQQQCWSEGTKVVGPWTKDNLAQQAKEECFSLVRGRWYDDGRG